MAFSPQISLVIQSTRRDWSLSYGVPEAPSHWKGTVSVRVTTAPARSVVVGEAAQEIGDGGIRYSRPSL
jgi:hypothetical protein